MKIIKHEHACWEIIEDKTRLIVDPGAFSASLADLSNIQLVLFTHNHGDHFDIPILEKIIKANPDAKIFGTNQVATQVGPLVITPELNKTYLVGSLNLEFFGKKHHLFNDVENLAVCINQSFFIPGDSYTQPTNTVALAAVPVSAPWLRIDEAITNIKTIKASTVTPTHDALLSDIGQSIHYRMLGAAAEESGKTWKVLKVNEALEI